MELVLFTGNRGVGKTLGMSLYATYLSKKTGCTLFSNYGLYGSRIFSSFDDFSLISKENHSILCLDECHNDIDTRLARSNSSMFFSHFIFYLRKLNCVMFMTTPLFKNVDSRVRSVVNVVVNVSKDKKFFYYDFYDCNSGKFLVRKCVNKQIALLVGAKFFDTKAIVTPLIYPEKRADFVKIFDGLRD